MNIQPVKLSRFKGINSHSFLLLNITFSANISQNIIYHFKLEIIIIILFFHAIRMCETVKFKTSAAMYQDFLNYVYTAIKVKKLNDLK